MNSTDEQCPDWLRVNGLVAAIQEDDLGVIQDCWNVFDRMVHLESMGRNDGDDHFLAFGLKRKKVREKDVAALRVILEATGFVETVVQERETVDVADRYETSSPLKKSVEIRGVWRTLWPRTDYGKFYIRLRTELLESDVRTRWMLKYQPHVFGAALL
jgi:hypothetical protein